MRHGVRSVDVPDLPTYQRTTTNGGSRSAITRDLTEITGGN
jgi:hypothetical protein